MFTVIVPTHNRPDLLRRTLQSLIAQTYTQFTVIVVDDAASYIPPYEELQALQGRYVYIIRSGVAGPAESRNMGLAIASSEYIIFLDDDDTLEPEHLQSLATHIEESSPALLFCDFKIHNEDRTATPPKLLSTSEVSIGDVTKNSVYVRNRIPNSCVAYRRNSIASIKHSSDMIIYEDWDFLLECLKGHELHHIPVNSVVIHKSAADAPANMRRGNTRDDLIVNAMLALYKKYPSPNPETQLARQALMASAGITMPLEID